MLNLKLHIAKFTIDLLFPTVWIAILVLIRLLVIADAENGKSSVCYLTANQLRGKIEVELVKRCFGVLSSDLDSSLNREPLLLFCEERFPKIAGSKILY